MCGARPDGRGVGVTETPLIDLLATPVMDAELGKCRHCDWNDATPVYQFDGQEAASDRPDADRC